MKNSIYDPETRKTYDYENEYDIASGSPKLFLAEKSNIPFFDDEVIEYAIQKVISLILEKQQF